MGGILAGLIGTVGASSASVVTSNLTSYYDASKTASYPGTGTTWYDLSPNGINATLNNTTTFNSGNGGYFNLNNTGDRDSITVPYNAALNNSQPFTVELWLTSTDLTQPYYYLQGDGWSLVQDNNNLIWQQVLNPPGGGQGVFPLQVSPATSYMNPNVWYQLTGTFTSGSRKLYLNGVEIASDTQQGTRATGIGGITIGGSQFVWFSGNVSILRTYAAVLSAAQVLQNFNADKSRFGL